MTYTKRWIHQPATATFLELAQARAQGTADTFIQQFAHLHDHGHLVVLEHGDGSTDAEAFVFESADDALRFFDFGFRHWERYDDMEEQYVGFAEVNLFNDGRLVEQKSALPQEAGDPRLVPIPI